MNSTSTPAHDRPFQILLVEDNPADVRMTTAQFARARAPIEVSVIDHGAEVLPHLREVFETSGKYLPDLILLDLKLPGLDGHAILDELKRDPILCVIPVMILTSSDERSDILRAYRGHANAYITKPVGLSEFGRVVGLIEDFWLRTVQLPSGLPPSPFAPGLS